MNRHAQATKEEQVREGAYLQCHMRDTGCCKCGNGNARPANSGIGTWQAYKQICPLYCLSGVKTDRLRLTHVGTGIQHPFKQACPDGQEAPVGINRTVQAQVAALGHGEWVNTCAQITKY